MKKTIDLLSEVVAMGFDREKALADIDSVLDVELGVEPEERQPLSEEEIPDELYDDIISGFLCQKEADEFLKEPINEEMEKMWEKVCRRA